MSKRLTVFFCNGEVLRLDNIVISEGLDDSIAVTVPNGQYVIFTANILYTVIEGDD